MSGNRFELVSGAQGSGRSSRLASILAAHAAAGRPCFLVDPMDAWVGSRAGALPPELVVIRGSSMSRRGQDPIPLLTMLMFRHPGGTFALDDVEHVPSTPVLWSGLYSAAAATDSRLVLVMPTDEARGHPVLATRPTRRIASLAALG